MQSCNITCSQQDKNQSFFFFCVFLERGLDVFMSNYEGGRVTTNVRGFFKSEGIK
jgi:hypothetical protein